jgi:hypothetical protein
MPVTVAMLEGGGEEPGGPYPLSHASTASTTTELGQSRPVQVVRAEKRHLNHPTGAHKECLLLVRCHLACNPQQGDVAEQDFGGLACWSWSVLVGSQLPFGTSAWNPDAHRSVRFMADF